MADVSISGSLTAASIDVLADNDGNFQAVGTGAAASLESGSNCIGVGVAVSINRNEAKVDIDGTLTAEGDSRTDGKKDGKVTVNASLTENMDGKFKGLWARKGWLDRWRATAET